MSNDRSREGLIKFLDYVATKGLMAKATANARKAAAGKVLGILSDDESRDVLKLEIGDVMRRFSNLHGQKYTPASLTTYQSRVKSALDDFETYLKNPLGFRPILVAKERPTQAQRKPERGQPSNGPEIHAPATPVRPSTLISDTILPIPIRADLIIYVQGLPFDLRKNEAAKIAAVITAMANDP